MTILSSGNKVNVAAMKREMQKRRDAQEKRLASYRGIGIEHFGGRWFAKCNPTPFKTRGEAEARIDLYFTACTMTGRTPDIEKYQ